MKAILFEKIGAAEEVLKLVDAPVPTPGPGQVLSRVEAAGVNFADVMRRTGGPYPTRARPPYVLGGEFVGRVEAVGEGVDPQWIGRRVFGWPDHGCYAEYALAGVEEVAPVPETLDSVRLVALGIQGMTAATVLRDAAGLRSGDSVYVEAAAGGVGSFALQLARIFGAKRVFGAASSPERRDVVRNLGGIPVDNSQPGWWQQVIEANEGKGVDVVMQMGAGRIFGESLKAIGFGGRMIIYGASNPEGEDDTVVLKTTETLAKVSMIRTFNLGAHMCRPGFVEGLMAELSGLVEAGSLSINLFGQYPLADAAKVHMLLEGRKTSGKIVLVPGA